MYTYKEVERTKRKIVPITMVLMLNIPDLIALLFILSTTTVEAAFSLFTRIAARAVDTKIVKFRLII